MKDEKLKIELANIICNEKFNTRKLQKIWKLIIQAKKEIIKEINEKWNTGYDDICISQEEWIPFQKRHLSTFQKEKRHNYR